MQTLDASEEKNSRSSKGLYHAYQILEFGVKINDGKIVVSLHLIQLIYKNEQIQMATASELGAEYETKPLAH